MTASIQLRAPDLPRFDAILAQLEDRAADLSPLMDRIGQAMESSTIERFDEERAPDGSRWAPSIRAREEGGKTLTQSARLRQSITHNVLGGDAVEVGTNVEYAGVHQSGFEGAVTVKSHKRGLTHVFGRKLQSPRQVLIPSFSRSMNLPARPFLGISADDELEIIEQGEDYLAEVLP